MKEKIKTFLERWWMLLVLLICLPVFAYIAINSFHGKDGIVNNGFFTFWLSGHMIWTGESPYSSTAWLGGHHANNATWIPNQIFPYPLPLALLTAPLGALPIEQAYVLWVFLSQVIVTLGILWLSTFWEGLNRRVFAVMIVVAYIFNNNMISTLQTGTIGALFFLFLLVALYCKQKKWDFAAGVVLALLALKPLFLVVVALIGIWLLMQRNWKMMGGIIAGGLGLFVIGLIQDVNWVNKFRGASENLFNMRLGNQPTIISYTRLACGGEMTCATTLYLVGVLFLVGLYAWLLWKKRAMLTPLTVFSTAIALGVLLPPYIWAYDYVLLVIPVCYICFDLIQRTASYLYAILFLLVLDGIAITAAILFALSPASPALTIQRDMWSIWVGILVLVTVWAMVFAQKPVATENTEKNRV